MQANSEAKAVRTGGRDQVRKLTVTAMLSAVAFVLMFLDFPIPMIMPSFVKMDFSDLPELLGAFALGPMYGVLISLIKNLIHLLLASSTNGQLHQRRGRTVQLPVRRGVRLGGRLCLPAQ